MLEEKYPSLTRELEEVVGEENVSTRIIDRIAYSLDSSDVRYPFSKSNVAFAVVRPKCTEEVARILKLANSKLFYVYIRGKGSDVLAAIRPKKRKSIILDLDRMNAIELNRKDMYVEVGPAVTTKQLNEFLHPYGYGFPMFPGSWRIAHIGGIISTNTSGHAFDALTGKPRNHVMGLEVVSPTGEIINTGSKSWRFPAAPDLTGLFVGGQGLFGVITKVRIRLSPLPLENVYAVAFFDSIYDAAKATQALFYHRLPYPRLFEVMDKKIGREVLLSMGASAAKFPKDACIVAFAIDGFTVGGAKAKFDRIAEVWKEMGVLSMRLLDVSEWEALWRVRETLGQRQSPYGQTAIDPPLSKFSEAIREGLAMLKKFESSYDVEGYTFGHLGGGTFHFVIWFKGVPNSEKRAQIRIELKKEEEKIITKLNGSRGEQGYFPEYKELFIADHGLEHYKALLSIKKTLDPNNVLNSGNLEGITG